MAQQQQVVHPARTSRLRPNRPGVYLVVLTKLSRYELLRTVQYQFGFEIRRDSFLTVGILQDSMCGTIVLVHTQNIELSLNSTWNQKGTILKPKRNPVHTLIRRMLIRSMLIRVADTSR